MIINDGIDTSGGRYREMGASVGAIVDAKALAYGDAFDKAGDFLRILYPNGMNPEDYNGALCIVRMFDKLMRIANAGGGADPMAENPWADIAGYALLALGQRES